MLRTCNGLERERVCVALSGGVDSCAVLASLLEYGIQPIVVSYAPSTHLSTDFEMARATSLRLGLRFHAAEFPMDDETIERTVRYVIGLGPHSKVEVESLLPMVLIARVAARAGATVLMTGDQSDGYFALSKWAAHNYDRRMGVPFRDRDRSVKNDTTPTRIDGIRKRYYEEDMSCSGGVSLICERAGLKASFPFRAEAIRAAFEGSLWSEINTPRIKEPIRLAWEDWFTDERIAVRQHQVNLHKGDSMFGDTVNETMMRLYPEHATARGLYSSIWRGEI